MAKAVIKRPEALLRCPQNMSWYKNNIELLCLLLQRGSRLVWSWASWCVSSWLSSSSSPCPWSSSSGTSWHGGAGSEQRPGTLSRRRLDPSSALVVRVGFVYRTSSVLERLYFYSLVDKAAYVLFQMKTNSARQNKKDIYLPASSLIKLYNACIYLACYVSLTY